MSMLIISNSKNAYAAVGFCNFGIVGTADKAGTDGCVSLRFRIKVESHLVLLDVLAAREQRRSKTQETSRRGYACYET
ncbi:hypothetical protein [Qipengyuania sp. NPDC077563]|uniref:hypothetical protein n=1 Tax=Qipengyuania sp. NPDC077563 TaxID=3364497 RepID=UPI0038505A23